MDNIRKLLVLFVFFFTTIDVIVQLSATVADWIVVLKVPALMGTLAFAILVGAMVAHLLLSLMQGTSILNDLIQEEPVEELVQ